MSLLDTIEGVEVTLGMMQKARRRLWSKSSNYEYISG